MCHITANEIQQDGKVIANALTNIANSPALAVEPTIVASIKAGASAILAATANWQEGSPTAAIDDAAGAIEAVLAIIPQTAVFAPLVAIIVAALDLILANIGNPTPAITPGAVKATLARMEALPANPYRGVANVPHSHHRSLHDDFKAAFNTKAVEIGHPEVKV